MGKDNSTFSQVIALRNASLGKVIEPVPGQKVIIRNSYVRGLDKNGCGKCAYRTKDGAKVCALKQACMAHFRPDGKSVIFINVK